MISPNQSRHIFLRFSGRFPLRLRFQEGVDDLEQASLSLQIRGCEDPFHPSSDFIAEDEERVGLEQTSKSESRCVVPDGILGEIKVEIEKVFVELQLPISSQSGIDSGLTSVIDLIARWTSSSSTAS